MRCWQCQGQLAYAVHCIASEALMLFCQSHPFLEAGSIHPAFPPPHIHPHNAKWKRLSSHTIKAKNIRHSKSESQTLTMSGRWPRRHSGHSRQTAGCADPGPRAALTTGQWLKLQKKTTKKTSVTAIEDCRKCNNSSANHTAKAASSINCAATNRKNQGN